MKLQISFDILDLEKAIEIAHRVAPYADSFEIGSLLLYKYGIKSIETFRKAFPDKKLFADTKIIDHGKQTVVLVGNAGADWVSVMAGANKNVIHSVSKTAHELGKHVLLDLLDAYSQGQSALEAKSMGVDALLMHLSEEDDSLKFLDTWEMVRGNSNLPIFISGRISREMIEKIKTLKPDGAAIGKAIVEAENPEEEAKFFKESLTA